ncbi:hypothetical protein VFPPC_16445 [Pochonia chlamydosporia 170]|uniref:Uncharacterized protein n=1 Tax=Pochonia chlamydosporia 170 TaxID=1380566 RepID=A0A179FCN6_METCM|nr:hypothetical protein VFPPC_16445 [Pochonia chlamydosporia 170]OAQ63252.1 hypothetical protein VFPPC_16445 [Pochonia chlamydosporia 170]
MFLWSERILRYGEIHHVTPPPPSLRVKLLRIEYSRPIPLTVLGAGKVFAPDDPCKVFSTDILRNL